MLKAATPITPTDPESTFIQGWIDHVHATRKEFDLKWGHGRLLHLVDPNLRQAMDYESEMFSRSVWAVDLPDVARYGAGVVRGLSALDANATAKGHGPINPNTWEIILPDTGEVITVCRTDAELSACRGNVSGELWSLESLGRLIEGIPEIVRSVNSTFPGAKVTEVRQTPDDLPDDDVPF